MRTAPYPHISVPPFPSQSQRLCLIGLLSSHSLHYPLPGFAGRDTAVTFPAR